VKPNVGATYRRNSRPISTTSGSSEKTATTPPAPSQTRTPTPASSANIARAAKWAVDAARSFSPAPTFCPTIVSTPRPTAIAGRKITENSRTPTP